MPPDVPEGKAILRDTGDVYTGEEWTFHLGTLDKAGLEVIAKWEEPKEFFGVSTAWRVLTPWDINEGFIRGRTNGLSLEQRDGVWCVLLKSNV